MARLFGLDVDAAKAVGTRVPGRQDRMLAPRWRANAVATALENASRVQSFMNTQPDPTLGAPFSSFPDNRLTVAQMGPGEPAENFPLGGEPRQWKYRVGWNFPTTPDTDRGIDGELLRELAKYSWLVRRCIEIRKGELCGLEWEVVPRGRDVRERRLNGQRYDALIRHLRDWLRYPEAYFAYEPGEGQEDGELAPGVWEEGAWRRRGLLQWRDWLAGCLEDWLVGDWLSIWPQRTLGNEMLGLRRVDGRTIKPLLDLDGRTPPPPMPAFQQYLYGVPRASWAADEFYYLPYLVRNDTPYGFSHVQQALVQINLQLHFDQWNTAAYTENRIPMGLLETPPGWTADQIRDVADFLNGAVASLAARQMVYPVPAGTKWQPIKPFVFEKDFAYFLVECVTACFDIAPMELGFAPRSGLGGKGFSESQDANRRRKTLIPVARWIESWMNRVIADQWRREGGEHVEFRFVDLVHHEQASKFEAYATAIKTGQVSLDELLEEQGEGSPGVGRLIMTPQGTVFVDKGMVLTANGMVPLRLPEPGEPTIYGPGVTGREPPARGPLPEELPSPQAAAKAADSDDRQQERRRREEEFLAAWLLWWRGLVDAARSTAVTRPETAEAVLRLSPSRVNELAVLLQRELREPAYAAHMDVLRRRAGLPPLPSTRPTESDRLRLETRSQLHAQRIAETYATDLDRAYQQLLAETELEADQAARARRVLEGLCAWAERRAGWKGRQVAATELTDAESQATADFAVQNPLLLRMVRWHAHMDDLTCDTCRSYDGQIIDPAQGPLPPMHPNCRCWVTPVWPNEGAGYAE